MQKYCTSIKKQILWEWRYTWGRAQLWMMNLSLARCWTDGNISQKNKIYLWLMTLKQTTHMFWWWSFHGYCSIIVVNSSYSGASHCYLTNTYCCGTGVLWYYRVAEKEKAPYTCQRQVGVLWGCIEPRRTVSTFLFVQFPLKRGGRGASGITHYMGMALVLHMIRTVEFYFLLYLVVFSQCHIHIAAK